VKHSCIWSVVKGQSGQLLWTGHSTLCGWSSVTRFVAHVGFRFDIIIIIIIIIVIILVITFMQGVYNYIPETNPVSTVCSVAAVLYLQSLLHVMLFRPCNMFCTSYVYWTVHHCDS